VSPDLAPTSAKFPRLSRRRLLALSILSLPLVVYAYFWLTFPSDRTPEGAYLRVVKAVNQGRPSEFFSYTEEAAQHACFTIRDYRQKLLAVARKDYPAEPLAELEKSYRAFAEAPDGADVFALMVEQHGWLSQLRRDMSGVKRVETSGPRATIETARGSRYSFRRRPGGIWGMTAFTPTLVEEAEKAARDLIQVEKAAADFARVRETSEEARQDSPDEE
jgi:hypothetical protein